MAHRLAGAPLCAIVTWIVTWLIIVVSLIRPDVAMARKAAIDPDTGGGRPQPVGLGVQAVALPRDVDGDVVEHGGEPRDDPGCPFTPLRIGWRPQALGWCRYREHVFRPPAGA